MALKVEHELHDRRKSRNIGVAICLLLFVAIVFGLTIVKMSSGQQLEGFDHIMRPSVTVPEGEG